MISLIFFLALIPISLVVAWEPSSCCLVTTEFDALYDFYQTLNGSHWLWQEPPSEYGNVWNFTTLNSSLSCPCTDRWQGITCFVNGSTCSITEIKLASHNLDGTIPESIGNFSSLTELVLDSNSGITGTIPDNIAMLQSLTELSLKYIPFTGTLPAILSQLSQLKYLYIVGTNLVGPIPDSYGDLSNLKYLYLYESFLSQSIPSSLCKLSKLSQFRLFYNLLTGPLPEDIGNLTALTIIEFNGNLLSQTLPESLGNLNKMTSFNIAGNLFTGWLPETLGGIVSVTEIAFYTNFLSGPLPVGMLNLTKLDNLYIYSNLLSGTIPDAIEGLTIVSELELENNCFSGQLPATLGKLKMLYLFYVNNNFLTGPITRVFNISHQRHLSQVELNNNLFTGALPAEIFGNSLTSFAASVNCFHGSIPESICDSTGMTTLVLDGASAAPGCRSSIFPSVFGVSTYTLGNQHLTGTIPACLYAMTDLLTLHLSGNNIQSKLDDSIIPGLNLKILDLSHNLLTGTIPKSFENQTWNELDLSFNKLGGLLPHSMNENTSLSLNINRFSGSISSSIAKMSNITILDGNIFSCGYGKQGLPTADDDYSEYDCGSNTFNLMIWVWIGLAVVCGSLVYCAFQLRDFITKALVPFSSNDYILCGVYFDTLRRRVCVLTACIFMVFIPVYGALRVYYSTHTYMYAWTLSAAFLSGVTPGIVLAVFWFGFYIVILIRKDRFFSSVIDAEVNIETENESTSKNWNCDFVRQYTLLLVNFGVVATINAVFVYITITYSSSATASASIGLAFFKLVWTKLILRYFSQNHTRSIFGLYWRRTLLLTINNVAIPVIATAIIDTSCFYNAFVPASNIVVSFVVNDCVSSTTCTNDECTCTDVQSLTRTTEFAPQFSYSYQCVSSLVTTYVPVFAILLLLETFGVPLKTLIVREWVKCYPLVQSKYGYVRWLVNNLLLDDITKPLNEDEEVKTVLNIDGIMMVIINYFTILLTWGVVFPPLTVMVCLAVVVRSYHIQVGIGSKVLHLTKESTLTILKREIAVLPVYSKQAGYPIVAVGCILCSFLLFDTVGDVVGYGPALGSLFGLTFGTGIGYVVVKLLILNRRKSIKMSDKRKSEVELSSTDNVLCEKSEELGLQSGENTSKLVENVLIEFPN